jgi:tetratricopeptide (TPR) repeat protein
MPRAFAVSLALLLAFSAGGASRDARAADSDRDWLKLETPRFVLYSNARERDAKRLLRELETFQHVVSRFLGLTNAQRRPALVYYFEDDASFVPYKPLYQGKPRQVGGFHADDPLDHVLALSRQNRSAVTMRVLFHEYTHLLTARQFRRAPLWAHEGVAEVFSTFESDGDQFDIGVALTNHVFYLQKNRPAAVEGLLRVDYDSREYNEGNRAGSFYATSWLLAHYLLFAQRGFESDVMARYADVSARMTNRVEAFEAAFGMSPKAADAELRKYVKGGRYTLVRQTYPELEAQRPRRVDLGPGEVDYALGRLLQMVQQFGPARERLEKAAASAPADPRPREGLALLAWREEKAEEWRRLVDEAISLGSREAFIHYLAAQARYEGAGKLPPAARSAAMQEGRRLCETALALDPWLAPAHHLLGIFVLASNPRAPALAALHVEQALQCDPQYNPAKVTLASLLAAQGKFDEARKMLAVILGGPLPPDLRSLANRIAKQIEISEGTTRQP